MEPFGLHATLPITATDDEIRATLSRGGDPAAAPRAGVPHRGPRAPARRPAPRSCAPRPPPGGPDAGAAARRARDLALDVLVQFRDGGCRPAPPPTPDELLQIVEHVVGGSGMDDYLPLLEEELALRGEDRRAPRWTRRSSRPTSTSGSSSSARACPGSSPRTGWRRRASTYVVVEKNPDVGGTWYENRYPGCRVDNPNHNYSYSFAQRHDWPLHFSTQDVLLDYFRGCARDFGVLEHIRFDTEVVSATWSDTDTSWSVVVRTAGREETIVAQAVVSAVGQLNRPRFPDIPGRETFAGPSFHSARVGSRRRARREARRGDRDRRQLGAVHARDRAAGVTPHAVPTHASVDGPDAGLPRPRTPRAALALRARPDVQRVEPLLDVLADGRRRAPGRARRSRSGTPLTVRSAR